MFVLLFTCLFVCLFVALTCEFVSCVWPGKVRWQCVSGFCRVDRSTSLFTCCLLLSTCVFSKSCLAEKGKRKVSWQCVRGFCRHEMLFYLFVYWCVCLFSRAAHGPCFLSNVFSTGPVFVCYLVVLFILLHNVWSMQVYLHE